MSNKSAKAGGELHDVVIVGGGAAGIATAASLHKRRPDLDILVIEPQTNHYYQPGWTLVGAGVFRAASTERDEEGLMPRRARWLKGAVAAFAPEANEVILDNGERIAYRVLVAAPGIKLDWGAVEGLPETLGKNGVTSNYRFGVIIQTLRHQIQEETLVKPRLSLVAPATEMRTVPPKAPGRRPNAELRTREHLTGAEVARLMEAVKDNRHGHRDTTMILLAYRHGLRASELCDLRWDQCDFSTASIHIRRVKRGHRQLIR